MQARSCVSLGVVLTYVPARQFDHVSHVTALLVVEKVPPAHAIHVRSAVDVPSAVT